MEAKLSKSQRQQIIFNYLKGQPDPLYEVQETKYGKYIVRPKQIELEEEEEPEPKELEPRTQDLGPETKDPKPEKFDRNAARRERRKRNRRAK